MSKRIAACLALLTVVLVVPVTAEDSEILGLRMEASLAPNSALVARGFLCGIGIIGGFPFVLTTDSHTAVTSSGNETLTCHGQLPVGTEPPRAVTQTGFLCGTFSGLTTDSQQTISPGGRITLRCQI